jgi:uncharacterized protein with PQ loop repeat
MKEIMKSIRKSKYQKLIGGAVFACLAIPFFIWGIYIILTGKGTYIEIIIPLLGMITCLISGLRIMFRKEKVVNAAV